MLSLTSHYNHFNGEQELIVCILYRLVNKLIVSHCWGMFQVFIIEVESL